MVLLPPRSCCLHTDGGSAAGALSSWLSTRAQLEVQSRIACGSDQRYDDADDNDDDDDDDDDDDGDGDDDDD
eukprot:5853136-Pyramimonas_sp.AAC.1